MWDMNEVASIEYKGKYVYHVIFDDGLGADVDFDHSWPAGLFSCPSATSSFSNRPKSTGVRSPGLMVWMSHPRACTRRWRVRTGACTAMACSLRFPASRDARRLIDELRERRGEVAPGDPQTPVRGGAVPACCPPSDPVRGLRASRGPSPGRADLIGRSPATSRA